MQLKVISCLATSSNTKEKGCCVCSYHISLFDFWIFFLYAVENNVSVLKLCWVKSISLILKCQKKRKKIHPPDDPFTSKSNLKLWSNTKLFLNSHSLVWWAAEGQREWMYCTMGRSAWLQRLLDEMRIIEMEAKWKCMFLFIFFRFQANVNAEGHLRYLPTSDLLGNILFMHISKWVIARVV